MQIPPDKPEQLQELDRQLTGPLTTRPPTIDAESGLRPPSWWVDDDEAAMTSMTAYTT